MEYRLLGKSGLKVSVFSFGTMTFGGDNPRFAAVGKTKGADAASQIDMCLDHGVNLFDTADVYSAGQSEEVLGEALGKRRNSVLVASKGYNRTGPGENDIGAGRRHLIEACEASLKRLKTDYIDLYQIHQQDRLTPPEETLRALDDLVRAGKVRYIGTSNYAGWFQMKSLAASDRLGLERFISQQIEYSLITRDPENELLPLGVEEGVGALIWSPLANGHLTGKFRAGGATEGTRVGGGGSMMRPETERLERILAALDAIAAERPGVSLAQIALNWVARKGGVASVIVGARTGEQLADNLAASTWSLTDAEMASLDAASATTIAYPYRMHRTYAIDRNPQPELWPMVKPPRPPGSDELPMKG